MKRGIFLSALRNFGSVFLIIADRLDDELAVTRQWRKDNGYLTHRLNYDLSRHSIVFDLGGYDGQWSSDIFSRSCCTIYVFEPVKEFARCIETRFKNNKKIQLFQFGLGNTTCTTLISIDKDASSIFSNGSSSGEEISLVKASDFINQHAISHIDLMKINIEGGEYDLLDHLIESEMISIIDNIQVQFHDFIPDAEARMKDIQERLSRTHYLTYQYIFVFENWKRK